MKTNLLMSFLIGFFMTGCLPLPTPPNENATLLHDRFHGKYEAIQSTSSEAIDVNLDGKASTDLLTEIPDLTRQYSNGLEIRIYRSSKVGFGSGFSFSQRWPDQYISVITNDRTYQWMGEPISYDPEGIVNYLANGIAYSFTFSPNLQRIDLNPSPSEDSFRWVRPQSVTINADDTIQVVNKRRMYTSAGVKDVVITTVYKRYTMIT